MKSSKSVRDKLLNIAKGEEIAFQSIIMRYFHERVIYRLSISDYNEKFYLKGGTFLYAIEGLTARPTKDLDFLGISVSNHADELKDIFKTILSLEVNDFLEFDVHNIEAESIAEQNNYSGIRLFVKVLFDTIIEKLQIDIGFGDIVTPKSISMEYPILLKEMKAPIVQTYTQESVIAEKVEAMFSLGFINSRMKDYYDVYKLILKENINDDILVKAIKNTFENRGTKFDKVNLIFSSEYINDKQREVMWKAFLNKINAPEKTPFKEAMKVVAEKLKQLL